MAYLVGKILLCLILAFAVGLILAWLLRRSLALASEAELENQWAQRLRAVEQERDTRIAKIRAEAEEARTQVPTLEASLADRSDLIVSLQSELDGWKRRLPPLEERIRGREQEVVALAAEAESARVEAERLRGQLETERKSNGDAGRSHTALRETNADLAHELEKKDAELEAARQALQGARRSEEEARDALQVCEQTIGSLRREVESLRDRSVAGGTGSASEEGVRKLEAELAEARAEGERVAAELEAGNRRIASLGEALSASERRLAELEQRARDAGASERTAGASTAADAPDWLESAPASGEVDDLKRVRGIGPVLEKTLNELGVYYYRQLAVLTAKDIEWLARNINTFPGRIRRDRWVQQARVLAKERAGD